MPVLPPKSWQVRDLQRKRGGMMDAAKLPTYDPDVPLEEQLKPCPFCGELPDYFYDGALMVFCGNKDCFMYDTLPTGWQAWETRAKDD